MHRLAKRTEDLILSKLANIAIVNETAVNVTSRQVWL